MAAATAPVRDRRDIVGTVPNPSVYNGQSAPSRTSWERSQKLEISVCHLSSSVKSTGWLVLRYFNAVGVVSAAAWLRLLVWRRRRHEQVGGSVRIWAHPQRAGVVSFQWLESSGWQGRQREAPYP
jgi:hypothetical protein